MIMDTNNVLTMSTHSYLSSVPHPCGDILLFPADSIGVDHGGAELSVAEPFGQHVQRDAPHGGVDPEPMAQTLGAAVRRIRDTRLDHHALDDLPDPHARQGPDRHLGALGRPLRFSDAVRGVEGVEILGGHRDGAVDDLLLAGSIPALLEAAQRDGTAGEIDAGGRDLDQLGWTAAGMVQRLAECAVPGGPALSDGEESRALLGVQVEAVSAAVVEAHFAHVRQFTRKALNVESGSNARSLPASRTRSATNIGKL